MIVKIYVLKDPITNEIRYIGRTSKKELKQRLSEHISKAKYCERYNRRKTHLINWIRSLIDKNLSPIIEEINKVEGWKYSHQVERETIEKYKKTYNLTNLEDKGAGIFNHYVTSDTKTKISNTLKQRYKEGMPNYGSISNSKIVYQFDKKGNFIQNYSSAAEASKILDICSVSITGNCSKPWKNKSAKGFIFSYKNVFPEECVINKNFTNICILNIKTNEIYEFKSQAECARILKIPNTCLYRLINNSKKIYKETYKIYDKR